MNTIIALLRKHMEEHPPNFADGDSVLTMLYECYNESNPFDSEQILAAVHARYEAMNGKTLREMDEIVYPVCTLCRDHEKAGFVEGVKVGFLLAHEII